MIIPVFRRQVVERAARRWAAEWCCEHRRSHGSVVSLDVCLPRSLLTDKQKDRLAALFQADEHVEVKATWAIYQRRSPPTASPTDPRGRELMQHRIESVSNGVPAAQRTTPPRADPEEPHR